ncbi:MAG: hypothetical protein F9K22_13910 [Bacteroidetes bacterium]|nr:MAG: hypothetical protein F9K22_13910 [Bacteroidota bacterium]
MGETNDTGSRDLVLRYTFEFTDGREKKFEIALDPDSLSLRAAPPADLPDWTRLESDPCDRCPLLGKAERCPVAVNLAGIVNEFRDIVSYESATVTVDTPQRSYRQTNAVQKGLSSIIGIYMVTSDCPVLDELRPMTRFHLPFATTEETLFRVVSSYLLRQYFVMNSGGTPDWTLEGLISIYDRISTANIGISRRIANASKKDANINAIIILHSYGESIPFYVRSGLKELRYLFERYMPDTPPEGGSH